MKKLAYLIHGWDGAPDRDWLGWAQGALREKGFEVAAPEMPDTEHPRIVAWLAKMREVVARIDGDTYFVGHSIGCQAIMRFLAERDAKAGGAIFVAGWFNLVNLEGPEAEAIAKPWIETPIDLAKVRQNLGWSVAMLGDNDPWVPYPETKAAFETGLGSGTVTLPGAGHVTADDGFGPLPQLLEVLAAKI